MDIKLIPPQTSTLIDANIFIYHLSGLSAECTSLLRKVASGEIEAYITSIIIAEILHRRMLGEAVAKGLVSAGQVLKKLKANPKIISTLTDYIMDVEMILKLPMKIIEATTADITTSHRIRQTHGFFVNDSINLACAQRVGIAHIATRDDDFDRLAGITAWKPTDI